MTRAIRNDKQLIVHFEDFASRRCRFFLDQDGLPPCRCTHPENDEREVILVHPGPVHVDIADCMLAACPLGLCLHPETETEDRLLMRRRGFDPTGCSDETWMLTTVGAVRSVDKKLHH